MQRNPAGPLIFPFSLSSLQIEETHNHTHDTTIPPDIPTPSTPHELHLDRAKTRFPALSPSLHHCRPAALPRRPQRQPVQPPPPAASPLPAPPLITAPSSSSSTPWPPPAPRPPPDPTPRPPPETASTPLAAPDPNSPAPTASSPTTPRSTTSLIIPHVRQLSCNPDELDRLSHRRSLSLFRLRRTPRQDPACSDLYFPIYYELSAILDLLIIIYVDLLNDIGNYLLC